MQQPPGGSGYGGYGPPPPQGGYGAPPGYGPPPSYGGYGPPPQVVVYQQAPMMQPKCSRTTYVLLGLFLGGLGIHNFVAGRVASGVIQLLIMIFLGWTLIPIPLVGLWVIIELLAVTNDGNGVRMS